jgi:hypothetical protein
MALLPSPTFSFTIPSVYDATPLDCRLYLPTKQQRSTEFELDTSPASSIAASDAATTTNTITITGATCNSGAILAHPYAPLGGCYDDPVVSIVGTELLRAGYVLGTFNFR